jgi:hypothetical protein
MALGVDTLQDEAMSVLLIQRELCAASLSTRSMSHLLPEFDAVCRQAAREGAYF